jgi:hypothetical protein
MDQVVLAGLAISAALNVFFTYQAFAKKPVLTSDARQLLHELSKGKAVVEIRVLDASGLFYRSPRG